MLQCAVAVTQTSAKQETHNTGNFCKILTSDQKQVLQNYLIASLKLIRTVLTRYSESVDGKMFSKTSEL